MKLRHLLILVLLGLFINPVIAYDYERVGIWLDYWKDIKKEYSAEVGKKSRPHIKFMGLINQSSLSPSLKKLDEYYNELSDITTEGKGFRKAIKSFKKYYKKFQKAKDEYINFIEDDLLKESKTRNQKTAAKTLQEDLDKLEKDIIDFREEVTKEKKSDFVYKFDLIKCDKKTPYLLEPDGFIRIKISLAETAIKDYKDTIKALIKKRLKVVRTNLEIKLIAIDKGIGDKVWESISSNTIDKQTIKALANAESTWKAAKNIAYVQVEEAVLEAWMKIRRARVRYRKYKIDAGKSIAKKGMALTAGVTRLVTSGGSDVTAYLSTAKAIYDIAKEIKGLLESPEKVAKSLTENLATFEDVYKKLDQNKSSVTLQAQLAKAESSIRSNLKTLKDKNAGLIDKTVRLEEKMQTLNKIRNDIQKHEEFLRGTRLDELDEKYNKSKAQHKNLVERFQKNQEVVDVATNVYSQRGASSILQAKEKLEDAYDFYSKAKTAVEKFMDVAETLGVL